MKRGRLSWVLLLILLFPLDSALGSSITSRRAIQEALFSRGYFNERLVRLAQDEGIILEIYKDSRQKKTIGIGHLLTEEERARGVVHKQNIKDGLTLEEALLIFDEDIEIHDKLAMQLLVDKQINKDDLSLYQINAVKDMVYQLGYLGAFSFKKTFNLIRDKEYTLAAIEAQDSKWYKQTKKRVKRFQWRIRKKRE